MMLVRPGPEVVRITPAASRTEKGPRGVRDKLEKKATASPPTAALTGGCACHDHRQTHTHTHTHNEALASWCVCVCVFSRSAHAMAMPGLSQGFHRTCFASRFGIALCCVPAALLRTIHDELHRGVVEGIQHGKVCAPGISKDSLDTRLDEGSTQFRRCEMLTLLRESRFEEPWPPIPHPADLMSPLVCWS